MPSVDGRKMDARRQVHHRAELVRLKVNIIVRYSAPAIQAAKQATGTITNLARPGGNLTGPSLMAPELVGKRHAQERSRMARKSGRNLISAG